MSLRQLFNFKHHKIAILLVGVIIAYQVFNIPTIQNFFSSLGSFGYLSVFLGGMLYALGFTIPIGVALLLTIPVENIVFASLIGGLGGLVADMLIFKYIHHSFKHEFQEIEHIKIIEETEQIIDSNISAKIRNYLLFIFAGFIIASPLPDEFGVTLLAGFTSIKPKTLAILSFVFHTIGIAALIALGTVI